MKAIIPNDSEANRDPLTGEAGAHPIGTGLGAAAGGIAAGAAVGTVAGPIGTLVGAAAGAIIGGLAGKSVGEAVDPTLEAVYWEETYVSEPYYLSNYSYEDYGPAYRTGYQGRAKYVGRTYAEVEGDLEDEYNRTKGNSRLEWVSAKPATQAAWHRVGAR